MMTLAEIKAVAAEYGATVVVNRAAIAGQLIIIDPAALPFQLPDRPEGKVLVLHPDDVDADR